MSTLSTRNVPVNKCKVIISCTNYTKLEKLITESIITESIFTINEDIFVLYNSKNDSYNFLEVIIEI